MSPTKIYKIVCNWSLEMQVSLTEVQLNELVDRLYKELGYLE